MFDYPTCYTSMGGIYHLLLELFMLQLYLCILYLRLPSPVKMFNHPPPLLYTVVTISLNSASILATTGEQTQFGCISIQQSSSLDNAVLGLLQ